MGKYTPFGEFLRKQNAAEVQLTFEEIEAIIGSKLPPSSKRHRAWWSNNPHNSVLTQVWLAAGFQTEDVDMEARKLLFRKIVNREQDLDRSAKRAAVSKRHPRYGALKGLVRVHPGTDLTEPADPDWGKNL